MYNKFDVIAIAFPFIEKPQITKVRPAVIISNNAYNKNTGFVVIAMVTSAKNSKLWNDTPISNWQSLELEHPSFIRMKFANLPVEEVLHKMGKLSVKDQEKLQDILKECF